jgi:hypothetical protein
VVAIVCPHCDHKTPGLRKDGFTKIFIKPLSEKIRNAIKQKDRLGRGPDSQIGS